MFKAFCFSAFTLGAMAISAYDAKQPEQEYALGSRPDRFILRYFGGKGIGFNRSYYTFQTFISSSDTWKDHFFPFLDLRFHLFNDWRPAANVGVGARYLFDSGCHAAGANVYYDFRKTHRKNYNQVGFGLEYLAPRWEIRGNGYFPVGSTFTRPYDAEFDHFSGNTLFARYKRQIAMTGGDLEAGWHFWRRGKVDLFLGAGPYCYSFQL